MPRISLTTPRTAKVHTRALGSALLAAAAILITPSGDVAWSQPRTIKLVVPYAPGGGADALARILADQIGRTQGTALVVENRPGAGTVIATEAVARAARDGNTMLLADSNFLIMQAEL
jgi:tripartite-type tricarboxylate transporter receptor subunit TctC